MLGTLVRAGAVAGALLLLAACGGAAELGTGPTTTAGRTGGRARGTPAPGGALTVGQALARAPDGETLLVRGHLVARGADVRLCSALAQSYPPQCGSPSLPVDGLDLSTVPGLRAEQSVRWTDQEVEAAGVVSAGRLGAVTAR